LHEAEEQLATMGQKDPQPTDLQRQYVLESRRHQSRTRNFIFAVGVLLLLTIILAVTGQLNRFIYRPVDMEDYWVTIPAGEFQMGSDPEVGLAICKKYSAEYCDVRNYQNEAPVHTVFVDAFEIGRYEVTTRQYVQCVRAGTCRTPLNKTYTNPEYEFHPVTDVDWYGAQTFCNWVGGRLPTEAEWEEAARGGLESKIYPWGNQEPTCTKGVPNGANFLGESCPDDTTPVGSFAPNGYGLYDMAGNVYEWVSSLYRPYPYNAADGREDMSSTDSRVLRGGSWFVVDDYVRTSVRYWNDPSYTYYEIGFRCSRSP
jgi:formylglycine-generating enzyme required for sulfatase activity